jgi:hypothetical protein
MSTAVNFFREFYPSVAALIEEVMAVLDAAGVKTRRNWWDVLAGTADGRPVTVAGRVFPILEVAQLRQGRAVTANAIPRPPGEPDPPGFRFGPWKQRKLSVRRRMKAGKFKMAKTEKSQAS